jgi:hypothetical protein
MVFVAALGGCSPTNFVVPPGVGDKTGAKPVEPPRQSIRPPVTAGQITGGNAQEKAQALRDEIDRDMERAIDARDVKPEKK